MIRCAGNDAALVSLAVREACRMSADFSVQPDSDELKTLTMIHEGVTRDGVAVPISLTLERD
jgi:hypothetical protein